MARMLRNSRNRWATYTDTCRCRNCRERGSRDDRVRRTQRARERRITAQLIAEETREWFEPR
jgi:hypothetical protein